MHQFVQSAIEAAKQGDNNKALDFLKQVLSANPNDIDAWLVLAAVVDDPQRKRQCLNRVLKLDPVNVVAREELLDMDRAEMGGMPAFMPGSFDGPGASYQGSFASAQDEPAPVSTPPFQPGTSSAFYSTDTPAFEPEPAEPKAPPAPAKLQSATSTKASAKKTKEKTLVFKYPIVWRIVMYVCAALFGCIGLLMAVTNVINSLPFLGFAAIMLGAALVISPTVEVSDKGIRVAGMFSSGETGWDEIVKMKSNAMKRRLELTKRNKEVVNVSTQVSGYPQIVEILQKKRPDLFGMAPKPQTQTGAFSSSYESEPPAYRSSASPAPVASSFKGTRTFKKSFFKQYASYIIVIPLCLLAAGVVTSDPDSQHKIGAGITVVVCLFVLVLPLFQVSAVKVAGNKLTVETLFEEKSFTAKEIREIKMQTVRGKYGTATNYVIIIPVNGKKYPLQGFSDGDEIIFGSLTNWWNAHRNG